MGHSVRTRILLLLEAEPRSAKQLATTLGMTHGRIDHHLGILEREGLVEVYEERQVRGVTERRFGPTFERLRVDVPGLANDRLRFLFAQAAREAAPTADQPFDGARLYAVRMPPSRAAEFARRLMALADEFAAVGTADAEGESETFGMAAAIYRAAVE
jgi:DNA-binding transcriptional ArsR family regulator